MFENVKKRLVFVVDERMDHGLFDVYPLGRIDHENLVEKISQLNDLLELIFGQPLIGYELALKVSRRRYIHQDTYFVL